MVGKKICDLPSYYKDAKSHAKVWDLIVCKAYILMIIQADDILDILKYCI